MPKVQLLYPEKALAIVRETGGVFDGRQFEIFVTNGDSEAILLNSEGYSACLEGNMVSLACTGKILGRTFELENRETTLLELGLFDHGVAVFLDGEQQALFLKKDAEVSSLFEEKWEISGKHQLLKDISNQSLFINLKVLSLMECSSISDILFISNLKTLTYIDLSGCKAISDLSPLTNLKELIDIDLSGCKAISDLSPLTNLKDLSDINLSRCKAISELSPLANLVGLTSIDLSGCEAISDLSPLTNLTSLTSIDLSGCKAITDLSPLTNLTNLTVINLSRCEAITDLSPLTNLT